MRVAYVKVMAVRLDSLDRPAGYALRFDTFVLDSARRTRATDGALIVPGRLARTGIQLYRRDGKVVREYRPEAEVFDPASLATFNDLAVTDGHPQEGYVTADSWRRYARGHTANARREGDWLVVDFVIQDAELIRLIESGERRELSGGYFARLDMTPGTTPAGESYDAIQCSIRGNHAAVIPPGMARAGRDAVLLDSTGNETPPMAGERTRMYTITIGGRTLTLKGDASDAATIQAAVDAAKADAERERDVAQARADTAEASLATVRGELQRRVDAELAEKRAELEERARELSGDPKLDCTGTDREVRVRALGRVNVRIDDDKSDAYVEAAFDLRAGEPGGATVNDAVDALRHAQSQKTRKPGQRSGRRFGKLHQVRADALAANAGGAK